MAKRKPTYNALPIGRDAVDHFAASISAGWQKTTESIIAVAKLCAEAADKLSVEEKRYLVARLPFGESAFSKLSSIGKDKRLTEPNVVKLLPPSYSTIYEATHLTDDRLKAALNSNLLRPDASRAQISAFVKNVSAIRSAAPISPKPGWARLAEIRMPVDADPILLREIVAWLKNLEAQQQGAVSFSHDSPGYTRLEDRINRAVLSHEHSVLREIRTMIRKEISTLKKRGKKTGQKWGFLSDELDMNVPDDELYGRIKEVLSNLGRESDDRSVHEMFYKKAEYKIGFDRVDKLIQTMNAQFPFATVIEKIEVPSHSRSKTSRKEKFGRLNVNKVK